MFNKPNKVSKCTIKGQNELLNSVRLRVQEVVTDHHSAQIHTKFIFVAEKKNNKRFKFIPLRKVDVNEI